MAEPAHRRVNGTIGKRLERTHAAHYLTRPRSVCRKLQDSLGPAWVCVLKKSVRIRVIRGGLFAGDSLLSLPIESPADNALHNQMIRRGRRSDSDAEVKLPLRAEVHVN